MKALDPLEAARLAKAVTPSRPATATIHDSDDLRLVVFRLAPGQQVPPHKNQSTVTLTVLEGSGIISGADEERRCVKGDLVTYERNEIHGMKADSEDFLLLASIAPRPGNR
jgi:quercetin dioxygenase-like cupin family protein